MSFLSVKTLVLVFFVFILGTRAQAETIVSESVGQAGDHVLTSREVQISSVIERILYPGKNATTDGKLFEVRSGDPHFSTEVTALLLETIVAMEAETFNVGQVTEADSKAALTKVEKAVKDKAYWNQLEVSSLELKKRIEQKILSKNFIKFKTESMSSLITDQEAQSYFDKNRSKFGNMAFVSFKDNIKVFLAQQQLQDRLRTWFEVIKRKYKARNFALKKAS